MTSSPTARRRFPGTRLLAGCLVASSATWLWACGGGTAGPEKPTIDRDAFIATYVDLRKAAVTLGVDSLPAVRAGILARHGVTEQDMLTFADVHGSDATYMSEVWNEVERRLDEIHPDSAS